MGINLSFYPRFVSQRPPILEVDVLNFKSIKVTCFAAEKFQFPVLKDLEFRIRVTENPDFSPGKHVTLMDLKFKTIIIKIGGLWETKRV